MNLTINSLFRDFCLPLLTRKIAVVGAVLATIALTGCASTNGPKADPFEGMNRVTFKMNDAVDSAVLVPVAKAYKTVTPQFVRTGVNNVFSNVGDLPVALNNFLQGKVENGFTDIGRLLINSTFGILGLFDLATPMGLEKHNEDFGQTLGTWGVPSGPYLVIPFLGPSTLRDAAARPVDSFAGYSRYVKHVPTRNVASVVEIVDLRASFLSAGDTLDEAALDKYQFLRDAFLQRRLSQVYDGKVPQAQRDKLEDDLDTPAGPKSGTDKPITDKSADKVTDKPAEKSMDKATEKPVEKK
jgi:phospholipid-binding lipoprotein MlaA